MFENCSNLTTIDLSSFSPESVESMDNIFEGCTNLKTIYVNEDWDNYNIRESHNVFKNCTNLVGGKGTKYNPEHIHSDYAHIDGGNTYPGYFTKK